MSANRGVKKDGYFRCKATISYFSSLVSGETSAFFSSNVAGDINLNINNLFMLMSTYTNNRKQHVDYGDTFCLN